MRNSEKVNLLKERKGDLEQYNFWNIFDGFSNDIQDEILEYFQT